MFDLDDECSPGFGGAANATPEFSDFIPPIGMDPLNTRQTSICGEQSPLRDSLEESIRVA
jgi:hypothetical protein